MKKLLFLTILFLITLPFLLHSPETEYEPEIIIMAVGDIMLNRGVEHMIEKHGEDFKFPFLLISTHFRKADILFGNLESVVSDKGTKVGSIYSFRAKPEAIKGLAFFDVLSVANNHVFDYGREALEDSLKRLKEADIDYTGGGLNEKESRSGVIKEVEGTKIAFLGYTGSGLKNWQAEGSSSGINWLDKNMMGDIKKTEADIVIVSMHFGEEYQLKQNEEQEYWAKKAIDSGADIVLGHHPHVVQPLEEYNGGWIAYSLGNFVFDQYFSEETMKGMLLEIVIKNKEIKEIREKKISISEHYQPFLIFD